MANTLFSCLLLQVSQIQIASFLVFCPFPAMFSVPLVLLFCACTSKKVLLKTVLPSANLTALTSSHCPSLFNPNETLDGVELGGMRGFYSRTV